MMGLLGIDGRRSANWGVLIFVVVSVFSNNDAGAKTWSKIMYGGFTEGKLDEPLMDDFWSGKNERQVPALFRTRKEAITRYEDVRRIELREVKRRRK